MTQEEKSLLIKDLCARLLYGVKAITKTHKGENVGKIISVSTKNNIILGELYNGKECFWLDYGSFKPYLRPMSSMTEEEKEQTRDLWIDADVKTHAARLIDFYNKHHFDYRGLIPMGLAEPASSGIYDIK